MTTATTPVRGQAPDTTTAANDGEPPDLRELLAGDVLHALNDVASDLAAILVRERGGPGLANDADGIDVGERTVRANYFVSGLVQEIRHALARHRLAGMPESGTHTSPVTAPSVSKLPPDGLDDAEQIVAVADRAMLALQHVIGGVDDGGIDNDVEPNLDAVAKELRTIRRCAQNIEAALSRKDGSA